MQTYTFNVYNDGRYIETVFYQETDPKEVRRSLINDGYSDTISVRASWDNILVIQGNHGSHGWEDESEYHKGEYGQARVDLKEYRIACPGACYRLIRRRVQK